jgi:hypothetical protein
MTDRHPVRSLSIDRLLTASLAWFLGTFSCACFITGRGDSPPPLCCRRPWVVETSSCAEACAAFLCVPGSAMVSARVSWYPQAVFAPHPRLSRRAGSMASSTRCERGCHALSLRQCLPQTQALASVLTRPQCAPRSPSSRSSFHPPNPTLSRSTSAPVRHRGARACASGAESQGSGGACGGYAPASP